MAGTDTRAADEFRAAAGRIESEVARRLVGQQSVLRHVMICLIAGGHALLEGVPGLGKTMLVRTLAEVLDLRFSRIQFTPDLMPADIVGTNVMIETPRASGASSSRRARSSPTSCWPTRSTAPPPRRSRRCWRRCRSSTVTVAKHDAYAGRAVLRARHPEPDRDGGHLPAARGAARPLPLQAAASTSRSPTSSSRSWIARLAASAGRVARGRRADAAVDAASSPATCPIAAHVRRLRRAAGRRRRHPTSEWRRRSCGATCATARAPAARRRWSWPRRSSRCSTGAARSSSTTCAPSPRRRSATACCSTSKARPRA